MEQLIYIAYMAIENIFRTIIQTTFWQKLIKFLYPSYPHHLPTPAEFTSSRCSIDTTSGDDTEDKYMILQEFLHLLIPPCMPPHSLTLKVNGLYMLLCNINVEAG